MDMIINRPSPFPSLPNQSVRRPIRRRERVPPKLLETQTFDQSCTPAVRTQATVSPYTQRQVFFRELSNLSFSFSLSFLLQVCYPLLSVLHLYEVMALLMRCGETGETSLHCRWLNEQGLYRVCFPMAVLRKLERRTRPELGNGRV